MMQLLLEAGVGAIWEIEERFEDSVEGRYTASIFVSCVRKDQGASV